MTKKSIPLLPRFQSENGRSLTGGALLVDSSSQKTAQYLDTYAWLNATRLEATS